MIIEYSPIHSVLGVSPHGIFAAAGVAAGAAMLLREVRRRGVATAPVERALCWAIPAGIVGARADYVISHPHEFTSLGQILALWHGGLALFGGLIGGLVTGLLVARRYGLHVSRLLDVCAPNIAVAVAIGRVGDLLLLDHLGKPTSSGFALAFRIPVGVQLAPGFGPSPSVRPPPGASCTDLGQFYSGCTYHLSAAYDLIGSMTLFVLLVLLGRRNAWRSGVAFSVWALWYGTQRLALDFTRGVDERPIAGLTGTQLLAAVVVTLAVLSLTGIALRGRGWGDRPEDPPSAKASLSRQEAG